jgi:hypothetical protein
MQFSGTFVEECRQEMENTKISLTARFLAYIAVGLSIMSLVYVGSYVVLMVRHVPAYQDGQIRYSSTFRFGKLGEPMGPLNIPTGRASFFNKIYFPADWFYYNVIEPELKKRTNRDSPKMNGTRQP